MNVHIDMLPAQWAIEVEMTKNVFHWRPKKLANLLDKQIVGRWSTFSAIPASGVINIRWEDAEALL